MNLINNVANSSVEYEYKNWVLTATLTADSGYIIVSAYISYMHEDGYPTQANFVVDSEGTTATLTAEGFDTNTITITGTTIASGGGSWFRMWMDPYGSVTSASDSAMFFIPVLKGGKYTISGDLGETTLCRTGYVKGDVGISQTAYNTDRNTILPRTLEISDDATYFVIQVGQAIADEFKRTLMFEIDSVEIINNIEGATAVGVGDEDTYTITLTSNPPVKKKYINTDVIYTDIDGIESHSEITNLGYPNGRGEVIINNVDLSEPITINGVFTDAVLIEHNLTNCTTNIPEGYIAQGVTIEVIVTANEGTYFVTDPYISYINDEGGRIVIPLVVSGNTASVSITIGDFSDFSIWGDCVVVEVISKDYGAINVYKVTNEQISDFASKRFFTVTGTDPETGNTIMDIVDLGAYVDRIKRLYVPIADGASDVIRCGEYNTNIACTQPAEDRVLLDFGTVTIPYYNGDAVDYEATIKMFIPFIGFTDIDVNYTGRVLKLIYDVNVVTGFAVGKLYCDDMLIRVFDVEPSTNVIYRVVSTNISTIGSNAFDEQKQYGLEPFVIIERYESVTPERNNDSEVGIISSFTGYSLFTDIGLITDPKMLMSEQELIYDALRQGVYIE